jgi:hypothetical protein
MDAQGQSQEDQPVQDNQSPSPESTPTKKGPIIYAAVLLLLLIGGGAFYLGFRGRSSSEEPSPTPTAPATSTPTPNEEESPTPTKKPSATPKPTATSTPTPTPASQSMTITSTATLDGWRASNGGGNNTWYIQIGRNATLYERGFVSFDISSIPSGKTIDEVTLRLYQKEVEGTPYSSLGSLIVDHLDYGDSLGSEDLSAGAITSNIGTLTSNASIEWKDLIVTNALKADISASRTRSQFRLRFSTEATGADAWARFESGDNYMGTGNLPQLVVKYH